MVLPKAKLTRSDFCVQWSTLLPEHSTVFPISPKSPSLPCPSVPSPISWCQWQWGDAWGNMWVDWIINSYMLMGPGFWKVTIAFPSVRSLSWGCPLQAAVSYHRNSGNLISLGFLLLHQIELKSIQQFQSCLVGERGRWWERQQKSSASFWPEKTELKNLNRKILKLGAC